GFFLRKQAPEPWQWVLAFFSWGMGAAFLTAFPASERAKNIGLTAATLFLLLFAVEAWLAFDHPGPTRVEQGDLESARAARGDPGLIPYLANLERNDPVLGTRPKKAALRVSSKVVQNGKLLYDVVYSSLESGWRVTPQNPGATKAVVFFGCSFTFGQGLEDQESIPYRVAELLGPDYQVFNFALYGYGAHQMLAQIQNGFVDDIVRRYASVQAYFITIDGHELRCSAAADWVKSGPLYLVKNGMVCYSGDIADRPRPKKPLLDRLSRGCLLYERFFKQPDARLEEYRCQHVAILAESARELRESFHIPLTVLLWPDAPYGEALLSEGVDAISLDPALPEWSRDKERYVIKDDWHPNAFAADQTARFIADLAARRAAGTP
ncbi:MAG: hypothetical protein LBH65_01080, partial [Desulfovibrio sp.]|nr:hypothetical protein [Desulfovibrio sp.]